MRHPAVYDRLQAEIDGVLGGRTPTMEDLPRLPLSLQVLKEAMRLYPPAYIVGREAREPIALAGHRLPAGAIVLVNIFGMHHLASYYPEPETFRPERFTAEAEKGRARGAYLPFGAGPRICIGNHFALMEGQLVLAILAQRLRLAPAGGVRAPSPEPEPLVTLRPRGGLPVQVQRRAPA
jgi:cytochrome P450